MKFAPVVLLCLAAWPLAAQGNYEVQVYGSDLVAPGHTMVELHSNLTVQGTKYIEDGVLPTEHAVHETVEITHGFNDWFETGWYIFTSHQPGLGWMWVGDHIRPRFSVPARFHWPVGVSLSNEIGYQRYRFSADTWTWEIRPIVDKKIGPWYAAFNPTIDKSFHGPEAHRGYEFSPNFKVSYDVTPKVAAGVEYYGSMGPLLDWDPLRQEQQMVLPAIDLNLNPNFEFNFGVGVGLTHGTDHLLVKMILGYRFDWKSL